MATSIMPQRLPLLVVKTTTLLSPNTTHSPEHTPSQEAPHRAHVVVHLYIHLLIRVLDQRVAQVRQDIRCVLVLGA